MYYGGVSPCTHHRRLNPPVVLRSPPLCPSPQVLECLKSPPRAGAFDDFLAQSKQLRLLGVALHDEALPVRKLALTIVARLAHRNPSFVMPTFRKTLVQFWDGQYSSGPCVYA